MYVVIVVKRSRGLKSNRLYLNAERLVTRAQLFTIWKAAEAMTGDPGISIKIVEASGMAGPELAFLSTRYAADYRSAIAGVYRFKRLGSRELFRLEEWNNELSICKEWPYAASRFLWNVPTLDSFRTSP